MQKDLFERALHIESPWFIKNIRFSEIERQLIIFIDFKRGSKFYYEDFDAGIKGTFPAYDTVQKTWQHLNFFSMNVISVLVYLV